MISRRGGSLPGGVATERGRGGAMDVPEILLSGIMFGESPRWHDGRLWFSDWGAREVVTADLAGHRDVVQRMPVFPFSLDWLPDGRLLIASSGLQRREPDGSLVTHADLSGLAAAWNEIVVDGRGNAYVNQAGFDLMAGAEPASGTIALATPDGSVREVADEVWFPNGMAVTPDNSTLIVAESYRSRLTAFDIEPDGGLSNRRVWADLGTGVAGRDLPGCRGRHLVRRRAEPALRARAGGRRSAADDHRRPRLLLLRARRARRPDAVHRR